MAEAGWTRTGKGRPCPVCGHEGWCSIGTRVVHCMRVKSEYPASDHQGHLHPRDDAPAQQPPPDNDRPRPPALDYAAVTRRLQSQVTTEQVDQLASDLGVSPDALRDLGIGYGRIPFFTNDGTLRSAPAAFAFPMYAADGSICSVRSRDPDTGKKRAAKGGKLGVVRRLKPDDGLLLICEGESDTAAALTLGFDAIGRPGVTTCAEIAAAYARGRDAIAVLDNDLGKNAGVAAGVRKLITGLLSTAKTVRAVSPPPGCKDLREWLARGATSEALQSAIEAATPITEDNMDELFPGQATSKARGRERIVVASGGSQAPLSELVKTAIDLLCRKHRGKVFVHGGSLVHVTQTAEPGRGHDRSPAPRIRVLSVPTLRAMLDEFAEWVSITAKGEEKSKWAPKDLVEAVLRNGEWPGVHPLIGVVSAPVLRPDGSILATCGYDEATGLWNAGGDDYPSPIENPSRAEIEAAVSRLMRPFAEFPYVGDADRTTVLSSMLTIVTRPAINGLVPMTCVMACTPGSGKTLLLDAAVTAMTGHPPDKVMPPGGRSTDADAEWRKRIATLALESPRAVVIDNVPDGSQLQSAALAAALTSENITDRRLCTNENLHAPHRIVWAMTGNNITVAADLARRSLSVVIDPQTENPHRRDEFEIPSLLQYVRRKHPRLVMDALTVVRGFLAAGMPSHGRSALGGFEAWDALVRACVVWATGVDPLETQERLLGESPEVTGLGHLLKAWAETFGEAPVTSAEVLQANGTKEAVVEAVPASGSGGPTAASLGRFLGRYAGRVVWGRRLVKAGAPRGKAKWRLEVVR